MKRIIISPKPQVIVAHDPSITAWGVVVIDLTGKVLDVVCIKTSSEAKARRIRKGDDTVRRVSEVVHALLEVEKAYNIRFMVSELPHGSQSASAAVMIGIVTGVAQTFADCFNIPIEWYSEGDSKKCLLGKRSATKNETKVAISKLYNVPWTGVGYKDESIADAMSIYHLAKIQSTTLIMLLNQK